MVLLGAAAILQQDRCPPVSHTPRIPAFGAWHRQSPPRRRAGKLFRRVNKNEKAWGDGLTEKAVWHVVREYARKAGIERLAPHDLRRTCARLCHSAGGELEQIQFLLGHVSIQTSERYLGCKQRIRAAVNDRIGIEPKS
jgi:integrase